MIVKIYGNEKEKEMPLDGFRYVSGDFAADCTALAYGEALAKAAQEYMDRHETVEINVLSEDGEVVHRLRGSDVNGVYEVTDYGDGLLKPRFKFQPRTGKNLDRYLVLVDAARNRNEFYKMTDMGGGQWGATSGRIGEKQSRRRASRNVVVPKSYPDYMFYFKLQEKLLEGYQDKSECHSVRIVRQEDPEADVAGITDKEVAELIEALMQYAQMAIKQNYTVSYTDVTEEMIRQAKEVLDLMRKSQDLEEFNKNLISLLHIIPRKIDGKGAAGVKSVLANSDEDYAKVLIREVELLDIMEGQILVSGYKEKNEGNILERMGLVVECASDKEFEEAKTKLNDSLKPKLTKVFRVVNQKTQEAFNKYLEDNKKDGEEPAVKLFWHGSRNENWFSILQKGLLLNPDAVITGKMFGNGIYFAPLAAKSWGYTSVGKWTGGSGQTNKVYMALYATAYGEPYEVHSYGYNWSGYDYRQLQKEHPGCGCVHAKSDLGMLYHDEVIFYREDQVTVKYICEFEA